MAENLKVKYRGGACYKFNFEKCAKDGEHYDWENAMKVCPSGWHLPSKKEFETLIATVGGSSVAANKLKSKYGWKDRNGVDVYGFSAIAAGYRNDATWMEKDNLGVGAHFWSSSKSGEGMYSLYLSNFSDNVKFNVNRKWTGFSVRCVKD